MTIPVPAQRKPWLDACRALAMILVIYGHVDRQTTALISFIVPIKIPLFFAISGYLFSGDRKTPRQFLKSLLFRLVIPWLIFAYGQYIVGQLLSGKLNLLQISWDILSGEVLWYMPCCILAECLFYLLNRIVKHPGWRAAACCLCFCAGYAMAHFGLGKAFALNVVFISQLYLLLGRLLRSQEDKLEALPHRRRYGLMLALAAVYLVMGAANILLYPASHVDIRSNMYNCLPLTLAMIAVGCTLVFLLFRSIPIPRWLGFIGRNTLVFYVLHGRFLTAFKALFVVLHIPNGNVVLTSVLVTALTCVCLAVCALVLNRWLPFIVGKQKKA